MPHSRRCGGKNFAPHSISDVAAHGLVYKHCNAIGRLSRSRLPHLGKWQKKEEGAVLITPSVVCAAGSTQTGQHLSSPFE